MRLRSSSRRYGSTRFVRATPTATCGSFLGEEERDALRRRVGDAIPVRRMGTVEDIGHAAVFLMTNPQVTGTVLEVSGGETLVNALE